MQSRKHVIPLTALLLSLFALPASAARDAELSYSYLELRSTVRSYGAIFDLRTDQFEALVEGGSSGGLGLAGSLRVHRNLYLIGEYTEYLDIDLSARLTAGGELGIATGALESGYARLALGARFSLAENLDFFVEVGVERVAFLLPGTVLVELPSGFFLGLSDVGTDAIEPDARVGVRFLAHRRFELTAHARYSQLQLREMVLKDGEMDLQDDFLLGVGAMVYLGKGLGLGVTYEAMDVENASLQLRWRF